MHRTKMIDKREMRFRNAADEILRSNRKLRDQIRAVRNFYLGDKSAPIPPIKARLETVLNSKSNGACKCLVDICEALKEYRPGEYPTPILDVLSKSTLSLIHDEIEPIQRTEICNKFITIIDDLHSYLRTENPTLSIELHAKNLDKFRSLWNNCCCKISDAFYNQTSKLLEARKAAKPRKKLSLGKGRQTTFMEKQRDIFADYLLDHPVTPSVSILTRAHKCWLEHKKEWDKHAKDKTGYSDYKKLARSK